MSLKEKFVQHLSNQFPQIPFATINSLVSEQLISPHRLQLPKSVLKNIQSEVSQIYQFRSWSEKNLTAEFEQKQLPKAPNFSVCNSFDFHLNSEQQPKLIEINTNAAFLALGLSLYNFWKADTATGFNEQNLIEMFQQESQLVGQKEFNLAIMDENPSEQRLYVEFLIYQQLFLQRNLKCKIVDTNQALQLEPGTLIYNRYTDFYLEEEKSKALKKLYSENKIHLSPTPWEYFLLADKQRLYDWTNQTDIPVPASLLKVYDLTKADKDFIWSERKSLFFKPKSSYGSKQAYKGASLSRKMFEESFNQGFVAQEYAQPSEVDVVYNGETLKMKYDLRCYTYKDQVQLVIARLYQGQTTNLKTIGGGFTIVDFV